MATTEKPQFLAIIGGSGLNHLTILEGAHRRFVRTPYGEPSCPMTLGCICDQPMVFLAPESTKRATSRQLQPG